MSDSADLSPAWLKSHGEPWRVTGERVVFDNPWIRLTDYQALAPTGALAPHYGVVGFKNLAVGVLPLHDDGTITLVGQHRFPTREYSWELPEGGAPLGADPLEAIQRELAEEAGLQAFGWRQVLAFQTSNSSTDERGLGYIATGLSPASGEPDDTEAFELARVPFLEALEQGMAGRIQDMISLALMLRAYHMAREGQLDEPLAKAMLAKAGRTP